MSFSKRDLQRWIDFLGAQITVFDAAYLAKMGEPHRANPTLVAFLKVNNEMAKEKVESAVIEFARSKAWPASALTGDQLVNLTHRAHSAREVCWQSKVESCREMRHKRCKFRARTTNRK